MRTASRAPASHCAGRARLLPSRLFLGLLLLTAPAWGQSRDENPDPYANRGRYEAKLLLRGFSGLLSRAPRVTFAPAAAHGGRLTIRDGLPVLELAGTPEQIGRQHGALVRGQLGILLDHYLLKFLRSPAERRRAQRVARELEPFLLPRHRRELAALARAAGMSWDRALLAHTFLDAYKVAFCSTAAVTGSRAVDGKPLVARNLDFPGLGIAHRASMLVVVRPRGRLAFAHVGWPGMSGVLSGINARGLTVAVMVVHEGTPYRAGMPYTLLFRRLLEEAATTEQALALLRAARRTTTNNLMICDARGTVAVAEISPEGVTVRRPRGGLLYCTNHFDTRRAARHRSLTYASSIARFRRLSGLLEPAPRVGRPLLRRALEKTAIPLANIQSMIFAPADRALWLSAGAVPAARGKFQRIDLRALLGGD